MATRNTTKYIGEQPPQVVWTFVRGDTSAFRVYVTDDSKQPLNIPDWTIKMEIKRPNSAQTTPTITDDATLILTLNPEADPDDLPGEFTVFISHDESSDEDDEIIIDESEDIMIVEIKFVVAEINSDSAQYD